MAFVLLLFVLRLSFFWCLGKAVLRDCGRGHPAWLMIKHSLTSSLVAKMLTVLGSSHSQIVLLKK